MTGSRPREGNSLLLCLLLATAVLTVSCGEVERSAPVAAPSVSSMIPEVEEGFDSGPSSSDELPEVETDVDEPDVTDLRMGQVGIDEEVAFRVESVKKVARLKRSYDSDLKAVRGADLWAAVVSMKNLGKVGKDPMCGGGGGVLIDPEDRNFEPHEDSISIMGNDEGFCGGNIQPGFKATVTLAFEIPKGVRPAALALWSIDGDDYFGESYLRFTL